MISLITINFNNYSGLKRTLNSIENQIENKLIEHIIIDGASSDGSVEIVEKYAQNKHHVIFKTEVDHGIYNAMNKGLGIAKGEYIAFLNSGDTFATNDSLKQLDKVLRNDQTVDLLYGDLKYLDQNGALKRSWEAGHFSKLKMYLGWMPPHPVTCIKRSLLVSAGCFDENYMIAADYALMLQIIMREDLKLMYLPITLAIMETGGISNKSITSVIKANIEVLKAWRNLRLPITPYWIFFTKPLTKLLQLKR